MPLPDGELALSSRRSSEVVTWIDEFGDVQRRAATPQLLSERIYLARQSRLKKWKYKNEEHHQGHYWFAQVRHHVWYETMSEYVALMFLDHARTIRAISAQPMLISFGDGNSHYPDYFFLGGRGDQTVFDMHRANDVEEDPAQFDKTFDLCQRIGWSFELFTGLDRTLQANLEWFSAYRHPDYRPSTDDSALLLRLSAAGPTVGELLDRYPPATSHLVAHLYNLIWSRKIGFDFARPLTPQSPIWSLE